MFTVGKPIWLSEVSKPDEFAEFEIVYTANGCVLSIAVDSDYNVFLNEGLIACGQYPGYPKHRFFDEIDLSEYENYGENRLKIVVWHYGVDSQTHIKSNAFLIFELKDKNGRIVAASDENTPSRPATGYVPHRAKNITGQLGLAWRFDATDAEREYTDSKITNSLDCEWLPQPVERIVPGERIDGNLVRSGSFEKPEGDLRSADIMQKATFCEDGNGKYYIFDLGSEQVGFPEFSFTVDSDCEVLVGWGEHLDDGRCRTAVRNFSCEYHAGAGKNSFLGSFRRFGCRYIQLFFMTKGVGDVKVGLRPTNYRLNYNSVRFDGLRRRIYETARHTLECCMHEHYEDCPWREQALYTLDSRNQMLCGYYAFGEYRFARASLKLMSYGVRPDGLLPLCFPAGLDYPIPSYTTAYFFQLEEYTRYSGDTTLADEVFPLLVSLIETFKSKLKDGLVGGFPGCWNFYEWSKGMSGNMKDDGAGIEAPLNAFFVLALEAMAKICKATGRDSEVYVSLAKTVRNAMQNRFFNAESRLFESFSNREYGNYSVLTNSLCLLCGSADGCDKTNILKILSANGADGLPYNVIPDTLSMTGFRYDALLREDRTRFGPTILAEIDRIYGYMLEKGATTFWETIKGADDFHGAGSLCHGWSALPIYYYEILA